MSYKLLNPSRYGSVSYGVIPHNSGDLLRRREIIENIIFILDDDSLVNNRLDELLANLKAIPRKETTE